MKINLLMIISAIFIASCAGSYNQNFNPDKQVALIYLGDNSGNRILFLNGDEFPKLSILRKINTDSTFIHKTTLNINKVSLRFKVGNHGPGFAYDWKDEENSEIATRYKILALDDSSNVLVELKNLYAIPGANGKWKHMEDN